LIEEALGLNPRALVSLKEKKIISKRISKYV